MPLTPRFEISQTATHVMITIFVPTVRVTNIEVMVEESDSTFYFYASPYLLQLNFTPHKFHPEEDGNVPAEYDPSSQTIRVPLRKAQEGQEWPHLDLTARLLAPKEIPRQWLHAVATSPNVDHDAATEANDTNHDTDIDLPTASPMATILPRHGYGLGGIFQNIFTDYCRAGLAQEMLQLSDPETTEPIERRRQRTEKEMSDFDSDRYLQDLDLEGDYLYPLVMEYRPFWSLPTPPPTTTSTTTTNSSNDHNKNDQTIEDQLSCQFQQRMHLGSSSFSNECFNAEERLQLSTIPYPLLPKHLQSTNENSTLWPGLLDLLVPFVYDHLTTMGDPTVESAWTITTLSSSLSWLDPPTTLSDAVVTLTRRMLLYPYWRNLDFCRHVWNHTLTLLQSGLYVVVKALLQTRTILEKSESYYVGNKLFVDPYLYWIQNHNGRDIPSKIIEAVQQQVQSPQELKKALHLGLLQLEETNALSNESSDDDSESSNQESESDCNDDDSSSSSDSDASSNNHDEAVAEPETQSLHHEQEPNAAGTPPLTITQSSNNGPQLLDDMVGTSMSMLQIVTAPVKAANTHGANDAALTKQPGPLILECD